MASLIYSTTASLDGYIADEEGKFDWAEPDEEVHRFINDLERPVGTYLLGRRMYEVLAYWDDPPALDEQPSFVQQFAEIWRAADKVVYSRTLETARTARTRIEPDFDPEAVRQLKAARAVEERSPRTGLGDDEAEVRLAREAVPARAARGNEAESNSVTGDDVVDALAHRLHDAGALVPHHGGPATGPEFAVREADIRVTHADGRHPYEDLAFLRRIEVDLLDGDRPPGLSQDCRAHSHQAIR